MDSERASDVLEALIEGNRRFAAGSGIHPRRDPARRSEIAAGQRPRAAVVACSDSRVGPEIVFDQGLGDLFIVRTAGNLLDRLGIESLEYAAAHLGVPLIVVMGHSACGAVGAAMESGEAAGHFPTIVSALAPFIEAARGRAGNPADEAARENVRAIAAMLGSRAGVLKTLVEGGRLRVLGAFYDIDRGTVEFFS
jgi:carbonic anhydrase